MAEVCSRCGNPPGDGEVLITIGVKGEESGAPLCGRCFAARTRKVVRDLRRARRAPYSKEAGMATLVGSIKAVGIKYVPLKDENGAVTGSEPVVQVTLQGEDTDAHGLADHLGEMVGATVYANITLEQGKLGVEGSD